MPKRPMMLQELGRAREVTREGITRRGLGNRAAALVAVLAACGPLQGPAPAKTQGGGELHFLHWRLPWPQKLVPMFEQYTQRTGTKITVEETNLNEYPAKLVTTMAAGTPPDVMYSYSQNDSKHYDAGQILDIKGRLARDKIDLRRDYTLMGSEHWCDKVYGMPFISEPFAMYYNKSLLLQAGARDPWDAPLRGDWRWDDLVATARQVSTAVGARDIHAARWGIDWPYTNPTYFAPHVWTFGGDIVDFEQMRWRLDSSVAVEAFRRYSTWATKERIALLPADAAAVSQAFPGRSPFTAAKAAFFFRSVNDVLQFRQVITEFEWDVLHVPRAGSRLGVSLNAGHPHLIAAQTKYPEQAYDFVKYLASPEVQDFVGRTGITVPALKAKFDTFLVPPPAHIRVFREIYDRPRGIHFRHHNTVDNWDVYGKDIVPIVTGERPLEAGLRELNRMLNDKVQYGQCAPYKGLKHPLPAGA